MRKSHYQTEGQPKIYGGNAIWNKCLEFFQKVAIVSDVFKVMGSSFQTLGDKESQQNVATQQYWNNYFLRFFAYFLTKIIKVHI